MWLRMMRMSQGGRLAEREAGRMVSEKMTAAAEVGLKAMSGGSPATLVRAYRTKVRANRRRMGK